MLKNYLKIAFRTIKRRKFYAAINITGLAIGLACSMLILMFVTNEIAYDTFHKDKDRVFRIVQDITGISSGNVRKFAQISPKIADVLQADYPDVESVGRIRPIGNRPVKYNDKLYYENGIYAIDSDLMNILTVTFISGNPETALDQPGTVLITQDISKKYFGDQDPVGKSLTINGTPAEITGVIMKAPRNSFWQYSMLLSMRTFANASMMQWWHSTMFHTFVKLKTGIDAAVFDEKLRKISDNYVGDQIKENGQIYDHYIQPVTDIHFDTNQSFELEAPGNKLFVYVFAGIGLLILAIAGINFMNLSTAQSANRAKEVGLRKVVGAFRKQLISQFIGESLLFSMFGLLFAFGVAAAAVPFFNTLAGKTYTIGMLFSPEIMLLITGITFLLGVLSGAYPAFFLSAFSPIMVIKGALSSGMRSVFLRKMFITGQFAISIALIAGTFIIYQQIVFMKNRDLGFDKEQKMAILFRGINLSDSYKDVKAAFSGHPGISGGTVSSNVPGLGLSNFAVRLIGVNNEATYSMYHYHIDADFIPVYDVGIVAGRPFNPNLQTDVRGGFIVNEAAVREFGFGSPEEAVGQVISTGFGGIENPIIGVAKDFHYRGLQTIVEPLVMEIVPQAFSVLTLVVNTRSVGDIIEFVEKKWIGLYPDIPFQFMFVDELFDRQYRSEERMGNLFSTFTLLALFVSCLGLFGLSSFTVQNRIKEIGIRKVLGANVLGITLLLSREFLTWISVSILVAVPVSYILMNSWLENFAYRISPGILPFAAAGLLSLVIALLTVSGQSIRAASANPAGSLRHE